MDLLIIFAIVYFLRDAVAEARWAALGKTSPKWQERLEQQRQHGKGIKPRYGSKAYFGDLWADTLEAQTVKRRERAEAKARAAELDTAVGEALAVAAPSTHEVDGWDPGEHMLPVEQSMSPCRHCGWRTVWADRDGQPCCGTCRQRLEAAAAGGPLTDLDRQVLAQLADPRTQILPCNPDGSPVVEPAHDGPDARVIPMFRTPVKEEVPVMSEVTGLQSAIAYAAGVAAAHEQHSLAGGEAYVGSLAGFEVAGVGLSSAHEAQEASEIAAGAWKRHAAELVKQLAVKEAYDSVPDAGNKVFVQGE
jgi:hypothetical protein